MIESALQLEHWPIERLIAYARNPRKNDHAVAQMAAVISEFGFRLPVVAKSTGELVDGHLRLKAARQLGLTTIPVVLADTLTDAQIKAFRLLANRSATWAEWDEDLLRLELEDLSAMEFDLALTGFDDAEIERWLATEDLAATGDAADGAAADESDDEMPDVPVVPVSRPGDLWALGLHQLICGDATDPAVVSALLANDRARLCFTSPPYGNQRDYTNGGIGDWDALMRGVFSNLPLTADGQVLVNLGLIHRDNEFQPYWNGWLDWMRTQGWRRFGWYVWDQGPGMPGDWAGRFAPSFEFIFHFNRVSRKPHKLVPCKHAGQEMHLRADGSSSAMRQADGSINAWTHAGQPTQDHRIPDSVIRIMRHKGTIGRDIDHPAVFPVGLPAFVMQAYSDPGDLVYEPFGGSGSTLLAAERTERIARVVEIAPEYVDVAIKRFQQNVPEVPVTLIATGQTFEQVAQIAASIAEFGFVSPCLVGSDGVLVAGHGRLAAARQLGLPTIPVVVLDHLTPTQRRALVITDNQLALKAGWDEELLRLELTDLQLADFDLAITGFDADELLDLLAPEETTSEGQTDDDAAPPVPEQPVSQLGDLWLLGQHRLLCGDATCEADYQRLLGDERVALIWQDPPYNVDYAHSAKDRLRGKERPILNDNLGAGFGQFLVDALTPALARCDGAVYIAMSSSELDALQSAFRAAGGHWSTFIIWAKHTFTLGRADYQRQYEPILYGWPEGAERHWCGDRDQGDVWQIKKPARNDLHPTMKPVELVERALRNSSRPGDSVLDAFGGSGTTLIAAEKTGRRARVMELDPKYVDVIIRRWQDWSGKGAAREGDGVAFDDVTPLAKAPGSGATMVLRETHQETAA